MLMLHRQPIMQLTRRCLRHLQTFHNCVPATKLRKKAHHGLRKGRSGNFHRHPKQASRLTYFADNTWNKRMKPMQDLRRCMMDPLILHLLLLLTEETNRVMCVASWMQRKRKIPTLWHIPVAVMMKMRQSPTLCWSARLVGVRCTEDVTVSMSSLTISGCATLALLQVAKCIIEGASSVLFLVAR
eukprot:Rmarinus@m.9368